MKRSTILINGLFCGSLSTMATNSLLQDWRGLEGTIQAIRDNWVPASRSVPVALAAYMVVMGIAIATGIIARMEDALDGDED